MTKKNTYKLINPHIEGSMNTSVTSSNSNRAGKKMYTEMSKHFLNKVDNFFMTIKNNDSGKLSHFKISEKKGANDDNVDFEIQPINDSFSDEFDKNLLSEVDKIENEGRIKNKQDGGKHRHRRRHHKDDSESSSLGDSDSDSDIDSASDSSSDSEYYVNKNLFPQIPIQNFTYFYLPYHKLNFVNMSPLDAARVFVPTFQFPCSTIEVRLDLW